MDGEVTQEKPLLQRFADSPQFPLAMMALGGIHCLGRVLVDARTGRID